MENKNVIPFEQTQESGPSKEFGRTAATTKAFSKRADFNIEHVSGTGKVFIERLMFGVFRSLISSSGRYTTDGHIMQVDNEVRRCSIFECQWLLREIDRYLGMKHIAESPEKDFFICIRNIVFYRRNFLREEKREK